MRLVLKFNHLIFLFFTSLFILGILIYDDYGFSCDEIISRTNGLMTYNYLFNNDDSLLNYSDRDYGISFELPLYTVEKLLNLSDSRDIYVTRHFLNFSLFYISVIFFYLLCKLIFNNSLISLTACLLLIISPRIFADSFYNFKDIPLLSGFIISTYTMLRFNRNINLINGLIHVLACVFVIGVRVIGLIIVIFTLLLLFFKKFSFNYSKIKFKIGSYTLKFNSVITPKFKLSFNDLIIIIVYLSSLILLVYLSWPYLWADPINNFIHALSRTSHISYSPGVLFLGRFISSSKLPWFYSIVWIFITTPLLYSFFFFSGVYYLFKNNEFNNKNLLVSLSWFLIPLLLVIFFKSIIYDGWRHLYFIYPAFIIMCVYGLINLYEHSYNLSRIALLSALSFSLISTVSFMIINHPFQNVYFNPLLSMNMSYVKMNFDLDYWGLSYASAYEYIMTQDTRSLIKVKAENVMANSTIAILPREWRERIEYTDNISSADYFLSNYRYHPWDYNGTVFHKIYVGNTDIMVVLKLK